MFTTKISINKCVTVFDGAEISEVSVGTIIHIKCAGFYILCALDSTHIALIGLDGGNRWDEPFEVENHQFKFNISLIDKMLTGFEYEFIHNANIYVF